MRFTQVAWGGPLGPRRAPASAHRQAGQGAGSGRGCPPHRAACVQHILK